MFDHCCGLGSLKLSAVFGNRYLISFVAGSCVMSAALCNSAAICAMSYYKTHVSLMDRLLSTELQADVTHNYFLSSVVTSRTYSSLANGMVNASPSTMQYSENSSISRAFGVNDPLGAARQPVDLSLRVPARANRHDLLHAGYVLAPTVLDGFSQVLQAHHRGTVVSATLIVRRRFKVLCQVGSEALAAREVGGDDAEDAPTTLTALWIRALIIGSLFHQLAINLVTQLLIFVTMLWTRTKIWFR
ncbi:hypothetical protein ALC57_16895 [Trachymyrmex cornetzi]|uniref:Uncharacterized protein n=1 Tax=Trachymyrmex cornetzi TaxID=471704 RepID=A0A151IU46_9HYME|nr:hypothetical protein ALC57_16895 [Trachymyrmex cornetzi]